jgi:hypothetical protein
VRAGAWNDLGLALTEVRRFEEAGTAHDAEEARAVRLRAAAAYE